MGWVEGLDWGKEEDGLGFMYMLGWVEFCIIGSWDNCISALFGLGLGGVAYMKGLWVISLSLSEYINVNITCQIFRGHLG